ncbi:MAG: Lrp/AsnC family transcriptional regulator [Promethearchaeota archaeon]
MTSNNIDSIDNLDGIDRQILELLQEDAKTTIKEISIKTGKSQTAVRERIKKLEDSLIKKYAAIVDCRRLGYHEMVLASLRVNSTKPLEQIKTQVEQIYEIKYAYIVTGEYPIFLMFKCLGHEQAMSVIGKLRNLPGVEEVKTEIVLDRIKEDHSIIIP